MKCTDTLISDAGSTRLHEDDVDAFNILPPFELFEIEDQDIGMATTS